MSFHLSIVVRVFVAGVIGTEMSESICREKSDEHRCVRYPSRAGFNNGKRNVSV
ncbi:hypothetical protein HMPREF1861_01775 [Corynebacterium kroppenstedtii]|nr:hypothetical protein HMPREF1861_01775 [Corynebacterium kroppenstedtii]